MGWCSVVENHEILHIKWLKVTGRKYKDWDIVPPSTKWIKVVDKGQMVGLVG